MHPPRLPVFMLVDKNHSLLQTQLLLGEFEKSRKATISFDMSVHMEHFGSHSTKFHETLHLSIFLNRVEKIQVQFKSDNNNAYFTCTFLCIDDKSRRENQNTHLVFNNLS